MSTSSYQPFLIGSGQNKTGLFQYLASWQKPEDAFDEIFDAYVNRGQIWKRDGETLLGNLTYCNSQLLDYGTGAAGVYSGSFSSNTPRGGHLPIVAGSVTVRTITAANSIETYADSGTGILLGDMGGTGTINYTTGAWLINSVGALPNGSPITINYSFIGVSASNPHLNVSVVATGDGGGGIHSGTFSSLLPIVPGSVFMVVRESTGTETYLDNGSGTLTGSIAGIGTINYSTGDWTFTPGGGATVILGSPIQFAMSQVGSTFTIMGINQWNDESNNTFQLVVEDTRRLSVFDGTSLSFDPICDVAETLFVLSTSTTPQSFDNGSTGVIPTFQLIAPLSIVLTLVNPVTGLTISTTTDDGAGKIVNNAFFATLGTIDYLTGRFRVNIANAGLTAGWAINVTFTLQNDYFTGDTSNFFNWTNWEPPTNLIVTDIQTIADSTQFQRGFLYVTNNVDPVTLYYGNDRTLSRPAYAVQQDVLGLGKNQILRMLDVKVYQNRLLFVRPTTTISDGNPDPQSIRWSAQFQPTNFVSDIPGSGGELSASTSDWIQCAKFLKDFIIVFMQNSTWTFRGTGNAFDPFRFFKINSTKNTSAPYGAIEYDDQVTSMGTKGLISCDGNALERYDLKIIDQFEDVNQEDYKQCFAQRFDILNQAWMLYPAMNDNEPLSTKVLLWNYIEDSWAVFRMPLSVLGLGFGIKDATWASFSISWEEADFAWNSYLVQKEALRLVGGDFDGNVFQLNDGSTDNGNPITFSITTKKYNPFSQQGLKAAFGYLDIYYTVVPDVVLTIDFFINNSTNTVITRTLSLTGTPGADFGWQRIFINVQAEFIQWIITDNALAGFRILGQILWASPAGRLTR